MLSDRRRLEPGRAASWMIQAFDFALANNVVAMSYYDSSLNSPGGSWVLDQERTVAMAMCREHA